MLCDFFRVKDIDIRPPSVIDGPTFDQSKLNAKIREYHKTMLQTEDSPYPPIHLYKTDKTRAFIRAELHYCHPNQSSIPGHVGWINHRSEEDLDHTLGVIARHCGHPVTQEIVKVAYWLMSMYYNDVKQNEECMGNLLYVFNTYGVNARVFFALMESFDSFNMTSICKVAHELAR